MPAMRTTPRRSLTSAKASLGTRSVVMMARATSEKLIFRQPRDHSWYRIDDFLGLEFDANHARGCGQHLADRQLQTTGGGSRAGQCHGVSGSSGAVGVARIDENGAYQAFGRFQVLAAEFDRSGLGAVLGEDRRGGGRHPGNDQGQIIAFDIPDSGISGGVSVPQRQKQRYSPNLSFSARRWPLAKSSAKIRLRPSS